MNNLGSKSSIFKTLTKTNFQPRVESQCSATSSFQGQEQSEDGQKHSSLKRVR